MIEKGAGSPITLGDYRTLCVILGGGEDNAAVRFFDAKIAEQGWSEIVLAPKSQMFVLITKMLEDEKDGNVE